MPLSLADVLSAQAGGGPVYEGGPDANVTPGGVLAALGLGGPSWLDAARKQTGADIAAYQRGGVPEMMADTGPTQELAGGFGGTTTPAKGVGKLTPAVKIGDKTFTGLNHPLAVQEAEKTLGPNLWDKIEGDGGYVTGDGNYLTRREASNAVGWAGGRIKAEQLHMLQTPEPQGIRAYHGSPYDFEKFDISKIGTGEGAQAYGHGLYFAENPATAQSYKESLSGTIGNRQNPYGAADRNFGGSPDEAVANLQSQMNAAQQTIDKMGAQAPQAYRDMVANYQQAIDLVKGGYKPGGKMYEVNINAEPGQFLDWDKGGQDFYNSMLKKLSSGNSYLPSAAERSQALAEQGIPGIRYLDQGSRKSNFTDVSPEQLQARASVLRDDIASGRGDTARLQDKLSSLETELAFQNRPRTSNYVVFNPEIVDILKKYGLAGLTMGGVLQAAGQGPAPSQ